MSRKKSFFERMVKDKRNEKFQDLFMVKYQDSI